MTCTTLPCTLPCIHAQNKARDRHTQTERQFICTTPYTSHPFRIQVEVEQAQDDLDNLHQTALKYEEEKQQSENEHKEIVNSLKETVSRFQTKVGAMPPLPCLARP